MLQNRAFATALAALLPFVLPACAIELHDGSGPEAAPVELAPQGVVPCAVPHAGHLATVRSEGFVDVEITVGTAESVRLACDPSLTPAVHVEARGDALRIWNDGNHGGGGHCAVHVGLGALRALEVSGSGDVNVRGRAEGLAVVEASGSGDVTIDDLTTDEAQIATSGSADIAVRHASARSLAVEVSGSGDVQVSGASERVQISVSGSGTVDARRLRVVDADVDASGSGDVAVTTSGRVRAVASGSGDISVGGRPHERDASRSGSGSIAFE
jgi:hypothetical protein